MASNFASPAVLGLRKLRALAAFDPANGGSREPAAAGGAHARSHQDGGPRSAFGMEAVAVQPEGVRAFAELHERLGRPMRVAILSDFTRIPYANGAAFQTRYLYQELRRCGHEVTVIGPLDPEARPDELAPGTVSLPSLPLKTYPGVHLPLPLASWVYDADRWDFDVIFAQTTSMLLEFGIWLRKMKGIPLLAVNTTHLAAAYDVLLPAALSKIDAVHAGLELALKRPYERLFAKLYNDTDGLVVLSEGLKTYWQERGVRVPIHVIPRAVQPQVFDKSLGGDPYVHLAGGADGPRLLCAGRHTREKSQDRVIRIFARHVAPHVPDATLTVLGDGPDRAYYEKIAEKEGVADRVFFPGEVPFTQMADFYAYADVFLHGSLSETYGNVLGEALWCGTPTVAFVDSMGASAQVSHSVNGLLLDPGADDEAQSRADAEFGVAVVRLLASPEDRARLGSAASRLARERCAPLAVERKIADAFLGARDHMAQSGVAPATGEGRVARWRTTFRHFRSWTTFMGGIYVVGHLRPAPERRDRANLHPQIHV